MNIIRVEIKAKTCGYFKWNIGKVERLTFFFLTFVTLRVTLIHK